MKQPEIIQRCFLFSVSIIRITYMLPKTPTGYALADQLIRSGTAVGANLVEAQDSISKKEFMKTIRISLKECRESIYWLKLICEANVLPAKGVLPIMKEAHELRLILAAILKSSKKKREA